MAKSLRVQLDEQIAINRELVLKLEAQIAARNRAEKRVVKLTNSGPQQRKPWVSVRRNDDGKWLVFNGYTQVAELPDFASAQTHAKELSIAH